MFGLEMPFAEAIAETDAPKRTAMPLKVSPLRTVYVELCEGAAGAAGAVEPPPGRRSFWAGEMRLGSEMPFSDASARTVVLKRTAMPLKLSPLRTVYVEPRA